MAGFGRKKKSNENDDESFKKVKINKDNLRKALRVFQFIKPYRLTFGIGLFILLLSSMATMIFPWLVGDLVDARAEKINNIDIRFCNGKADKIRLHLAKVDLNSTLIGECLLAAILKSMPEFLSS